MARHYSAKILGGTSPDVDELNYYRNQAARFSAIVDSQPDCVKIVSQDYHLIDMNFAGLDMIDAQSIEEVRGANVLDLVDPGYHAAYKQSVDDVYAGKSSVCEFTITGLKGSKRRMSQHGAPIFNSDNPNEVIEMVAVTRDVSEQHDALMSLEGAKMVAEEANKVKSNFLATMSHEFRTPLNAILGFSEIIQSQSFGALGNDRYIDYVNDIHSSGRHLLDLINDVLDISEIEADKRVILKEEIDLEEIALHSLSTVNVLAEKKQIMISVNIAANLPTVYADRRSVKQILINLLSNAIKFSHDGGIVMLTVHAHEDRVKIAIKDEGVGITEENLRQITEPFFRGERDADIAAPGTGLGLSIVKSLLDAHNGKLQITSTEHVGTSVSISFPVHGSLNG